MSSPNWRPSIPDPGALPGTSSKANTVGMIVVRLDHDLSWREFDIPDGNCPVNIARLRPDDPSTLLVRFPDGWERPGTGSYEGAEEFVVVDGALHMSGATYRTGDWAFVPATARRHATSAGPEVLSLARFFGPARWRAGTGATIAALTGSLLGAPGSLLGAPGFSISSPLGAGSARLLRSSGGVSSWVLEVPRERASFPFDTELLALDERVWAWVPGGSAMPRLEGRCFCRTFGASGTGGRP